jgi:DNA-binding MarR family transcriptional regulator
LERYFVHQTTERATAAERQLIIDLVEELRGVSALRRELHRLLPHVGSFAGLGLLARLERSGPVRLGALADMARVDASVTSRQVSQLEKEELVERVPDPADGRSCLVGLSPAGQAQLDELRDAVVDRWAFALSGWTAEDLGALVTGLRRLSVDLETGEVTA